MSVSDGALQARDFLFDAERLERLADERAASYRSATPFPHVVIDNFLPESVLRSVLAEFPTHDELEWIEFDSDHERKLASRDTVGMGPSTRLLLDEFNSSVFVKFLERLTGIDGLIPDPHFEGGGLHQIERGGFLKVHADFNRHNHLSLSRRLNAIVYANEGWEEEYGGHLELWDRDMKHCVERVLPVWNRCVIFSTSETSYHGHPDPLTCPEGRTRKSLALYYYTADAPVSPSHNTLFQERPHERPPADRVKTLVKRVVPPIAVDAARRMRGRRP